MPLKRGRTGCATSVGKVERNYFLCPRYHMSINVLLEANEQQIFEILTSLMCLKLSDIPEIIISTAGCPLESPEMVKK